MTTDGGVVSEINSFEYLEIFVQKNRRYYKDVKHRQIP